jgi:hypothetical protein
MSALFGLRGKEGVIKRCRTNTPQAEIENDISSSAETFL